MRRGLVALVCAGVFAAPAGAALPRSTVDRLDEARGAPAGAARCTAQLGTRALRAISASFTASAARCRWRLPAGSKGKRFRGTVQATVSAQKASRSFSRVVR